MLWTSKYAKVPKFHYPHNFLEKTCNCKIYVKLLIISIAQYDQLMFFSYTVRYDLFDTMIFPKAKPDGAMFVGGFIKGIKSWITGQAAETVDTVEVFPISDKRNNGTCLQIYLHDDLNLIRTGSIQRNILLNLYQRIIDIYKSMHSSSIAYGGSKNYIAKKLACKELQNVRN